MKNGRILILSGPSGCGKSSILKAIFKRLENYYFSISTTTRDKRVGEVEGVDYNFISKDEFLKDIQNELFIEWAEVHNNYYGTSLKPIMQALDDGKLVIFDIDVQGHKILREKLSRYITSIFITTPSQKILKNRLISRDTDNLDIIDKRIKNALDELDSLDSYDYLVINDNLDTAIKQIETIIEISKLKAVGVDKNKFKNQWVSK